MPPSQRIKAKGRVNKLRKAEANAWRYKGENSARLGECFQRNKITNEKFMTRLTLDDSDIEKSQYILKTVKFKFNHRGNVLIYIVVAESNKTIKKVERFRFFPLTRSTYKYLLRPLPLWCCYIYAITQQYCLYSTQATEKILIKRSLVRVSYLM